MTGTDLTSIRNLLRHPYIIRNHVAEELYGESSKACYTRLHSRASGRHRFREEEYKELRKLFRRLAKTLEKTAARLEKMEQGASRSRQSPLEALEHYLINLKPVLERSQQDTELSYTQCYDMLRQRTDLPKGTLAGISEELQRFSAEILAALDQAKQEARQYNFSYGRGKASHL